MDRVIGIEFNTGFEFWTYLVINYGLDKAARYAKDYLDCPIDKTDGAEMEFRRDLYKQVKNYDDLFGRN